MIGLARRPPSGKPGYPVIAADLADAAACHSQLGSLGKVTHVFYCARASHTASTKEPIDLNAAMLRNLMDAIEPVARGLNHVHLVQGSKYYGSDLGPYKTPARESDPRIAEYFGMQAGPVKTGNLAQTMADKAPAWDRIVARHRLKPVPYAETALWSYGDFVFTPGYDIMSDTLKLRQSGLTGSQQTVKMVFHIFDSQELT